VGGDNTANDLAALQQFRLYSPGTPREISSGDGTADDTSPSRGLMRHIGHWGATYVPAMAMLPRLREDRPNRGSDHKSFIAKGVPGVRFIDANENLAHQHSPNDLIPYLTPSYTASLARVVAASAASLARASTPPRSMTAQRLSSSSVRLRWTEPASGPPVDHYVISARSLTENLYRTRFVVAGDATSATVSVPGDLGIPSGTSYYVSVAAVDAAGHESLYAYPEYRCSSSSCRVPRGSLDVTATR
jgi:Fibronectin type III domain